MDKYAEGGEKNKDRRKERNEDKGERMKETARGSERK